MSLNEANAKLEPVESIARYICLAANSRSASGSMFTQTIIYLTPGFRVFRKIPGDI